MFPFFENTNQKQNTIYTTRLTVESEPAKPDEASSYPDEERIVRFEMDDLGPLPGSVLVDAWSQHETPGQGTEPAGDVHGAGAGKVVDPQVVEPAGRVPLPVRQDVIHERGPTEQEQHAGPETATLQHGTGQDHGGRRDEGEAEAGVQDVRDVGVGERRGGEDVVQPRQAEVAQDGVRRVRLVQGIPVDPELDAAGRRAEQGLEDHGQRRLASMHAGVQITDGRGDLPTEDGTDEDPT